MIKEIVSRIITVIIIIAAVYIYRLILKKFNIKHKKLLATGCVAVTVFIILLLSTHTVERAFLSFPTPQEALEYSEPSQIPEIVAQGENSSAIISKDEGEDSDITFNMVRKSKDGWKIPSVFDYKICHTDFLQNAMTTIFKDKKSEDYYIEIVFYNEIPKNVSDSQDSAIYYDEEKLYGIYLIYVNDLDVNYRIKIDGKEYSVITEDELKMLN